MTDDTDAQRDAALRALAAAKALHELRDEEVRLVDELTAAIQDAAERGVPRPALAALTGLSLTRVTQYRHDQVVLKPRPPFAGEAVLPPYPARERPGPAPEARRPGMPSDRQSLSPGTLEQERELMRQVKVCMEAGKTIRATSEEVGLSKSVVGRYYKVLRNLPPR